MSNGESAAAAQALAAFTDFVEGVLVRHVRPLELRVRRGLVRVAAQRLAALEPVPEDLDDTGADERLLIVAQLCARLAGELVDEIDLADRGFADLTNVFFELRDEAARRRFLVEHLRRTATSRKQLREDIAAVRRWLDYDALRERHVVARSRSEGLLRIVFGVLRSLMSPSETTVEGEGTQESVPLVGDQGVEEIAWDVVLRPWDTPVRLAALEAVVAFYRARRSAPQARAEPSPSGVRTAVATAHDPEEHPWIRALALETLVLLDRADARPALRRWLVDIHANDGRHPFVVRRLAQGIASRCLAKDEAATLFLDALGAGEPSEYVRMGLAAQLGETAAQGGLQGLRRLAGLRSDLPEKSHRVRIAAVTAAAQAAEEAARFGDGRSAAEAGELLADVLATEAHPLVLRAACGIIRPLALSFVRNRAKNLLQALLPALRGSLLDLLTRSDLGPGVQEAAAAADEGLDEALDPGRHDWTEYLRGVARALPPGGGTTLPIRAMPDKLATGRLDPEWLGRILAQISRDDWGLAARLDSEHLTLWRGDRYRRRVWRTVHELLHPAPNKRQAFRHTIGREPKGELRAPPLGMYEETATVVPGERVLVEREGSWARHLPLPDDLLALPLLQARNAHVFSSFGVTEIVPPRSLWRRAAARARLTFEYPRLARLRRASLEAVDPAERQRYLGHVARRYGIHADLRPYQQMPIDWAPRPVPPEVAVLFPAVDPGDVQPVEPNVVAAVGGLPLLELASRWLDRNGAFFLSPLENGQIDLAVFAGALGALFLTHAYRKRRAVERARAALPLCIGGWGTRGKSGTERLKAGMFHGLGYDVFVKTTGCEAMFLHSVPGELPTEVFLHRPYDKATIWEQRDMVQLAAALGTEVFLWECMGLTARYVELLQQDWMRDDLATLTNAYPDHEDLQGPAGADVAATITRFIPKDAVLLTTEESFLPLFATVCRERRSELRSVSALEAELLADDLLDLFPYREHPRNIALVARLAQELGVDPDLALYTMAHNVVPDIGVLKEYPAVRVRGRRLSFVNGMSANERAGFMSNWRRMELDRLDPLAEPRRAIVTVVNNRADRVSRSEVFARILVEDVSADRHVLIGTNLRGLRSYIHGALGRWLERNAVLAGEDLDTRRARERLDAHMHRLRIPPPSLVNVLRHLAIYGRAAGLQLADGTAAEDLHRALGAVLDGSGLASERMAEIHAELRTGSTLRTALEAALVPANQAVPEDGAAVEALEPPDRDDVVTHSLRLIARVALRARLERALDAVVDAGGAGSAAAFEQSFREAYRDLFLEQVVVIEDPATKGDAIVAACADAVAPGLEVTVLGTQNIKGTGLDFVYRWVALDTVVRAVEAIRRAPGPQRKAGLTELERHRDWGLVDAAWAAASLEQRWVTTLEPEERAHVDRLRDRARRVHQEHRETLGRAAPRKRWRRVLAGLESLLDFVDSLRRRRRASLVMNDLVGRRISHARAAREMRAIYGREKGGWLGPRAS